MFDAELLDDGLTPQSRSKLQNLRRILRAGGVGKSHSRISAFSMRPEQGPSFGIQFVSKWIKADPDCARLYEKYAAENPEGKKQPGSKSSVSEPRGDDRYLRTIKSALKMGQDSDWPDLSDEETVQRFALVAGVGETSIYYLCAAAEAEEYVVTQMTPEEQSTYFKVMRAVKASARAIGVGTQKRPKKTKVD